MLRKSGNGFRPMNKSTVRAGTAKPRPKKFPIEQTCGWVRVISVKQLVGTTDKSRWPASPEITVSHIKEFESRHGDLKAGEIVIFRSDYSDDCMQSGASSTKCMEAPLNGRAEGWPALDPDAILYLSSKGIRCVGTDGPRSEVSILARHS